MFVKNSFYQKLNFYGELEMNIFKSWFVLKKKNYCVFDQRSFWKDCLNPILVGFPRTGIYPDICHLFKTLEAYCGLIWLARTLFSIIPGRFFLVETIENPSYQPPMHWTALDCTELHANIALSNICVKFSAVQCSPVVA